MDDQMAKLVAEGTAGAPYGAHLGMECVDYGPDRAVFKMPFAAHNVTVGTMVHGGAIAGLIDATATASFWMTDKLPENPRGSTIGLTLNYLSAALECDLTCEATVVRRGGSIHVGEAKVTDPDGNLVATALITYKLSGSK